MAKPSLALIPSAVGDGALYSVLPSTGVGDFDFTRSGTATRVNAQGLIETVDANTPRLNYPLIDGEVSGCPSLLLEPARTNLITYSEDFSNSIWVETPSLVTVTSNQFISPDGTLNADRLQIQSTSSLALLSHLVSHTINVDITVSAWVKSNTNSVEKIKLFGDYGTVNAVSDEFLVTDIWKRIEFTFTPTASGNRNVGFYNVSNLATDIQIYGFQAEQGSFATSYIPTNGSTVTRSAETANGSGDADTFNDSEGVLFADIAALADDLTFRLITLKGSTSDIRFGYRNNSNMIYLQIGSAAFLTYTVNDIKTFNRVAIKYGLTGTKLVINGFEVEVDADNSSFSGINSLNFDLTGGSNFYGNTKDLRVYNTALTDAELEDLTSWDSFSEMATGQLYTIQ